MSIDNVVQGMNPIHFGTGTSITVCKDQITRIKFLILRYLYPISSRVLGSLSSAVLMSNTIMHSASVGVCGRKSGSLLFCSFYWEPPERSSDNSPKQCGWMFGILCVVTTSYTHSVRLPSLSTYPSSINCIESSTALMRSGMWLQSSSPIAVAGLWGAYCVYACLEALSVCIELGETETERPALAGWVMNLLLRHSLKHNYTHQS